MEVILFHKCVLRNQLKKANLGLHITRIFQREGAQISEVEDGSPAKKAGLQRGDRLLCINNRNVERENITNILKILQAETNKDEVIIKIARKQQMRTYENHPLPLRPVEEEANSIKPDMNNSKLISNFISKPPQMNHLSGESIKSAHGMTVAPDPETGNIVTHVLPNSQASQAGINVNDTIVQINDDVIINYPFSYIRKLLLGDPTEKMKLYVCPRTELIRRMHMGLPIVTQYNPDSVSKGAQKLIRIGGDLKSGKPKKYLGSQTLPIINADASQSKYLPVNNTPVEQPPKKVNFDLNMPRKTPYRFYENVINPLNNGGIRRFPRFLNYSEQARSDPQLNTIHVKQPMNQLRFPTVIKLPSWKPAYENDESTEESDTNVIHPTNVLLPNDSNDSLSQLTSSHLMPMMNRSEKQIRPLNPFQKAVLYRDSGTENLKRSISVDDLRPSAENYNSRCICVMEHLPVMMNHKQQQSTVNTKESGASPQEMSSDDVCCENAFTKRELTPLKNAEICVSIKKQPAQSSESGKNAPTRGNERGHQEITQIVLSIKQTDSEDKVTDPKKETKEHPKKASNVKNIHINAEDDSAGEMNGSASIAETNGTQSLRKRKRHKKEFSRSPAKTENNGSSTTNDEVAEKENTKRPTCKTTKIVPVDIKTSSTSKKKNSREKFTSTHELKITKIPISSTAKSPATLKGNPEYISKPNTENTFKSTVTDKTNHKAINEHPVSVHSIHEEDDDELTLIAQSTYNPFKEKKLPSKNHQCSPSIIPVKRIGQLGIASPDEVYTNGCRESTTSSSDSVSIMSSNRDGFDGTTNFSNAFTQTDESIHTDVVFRDLSSRIDDIDSLMDSYDMTPSAFAAIENQDNTDDSKDNANDTRALIPMDYMNGKSNLIIKEFDKDMQQNLNSNKEHYMILKKEKGKDEKKTAIILRRIEDRFIETKVVNTNEPGRTLNTSVFDKTKSIYDNVSEMVLVNVVRDIKPEDKLGLKLKENRKDPHKIINVENESVCSKAGLKAETLILSVNDKDTTKMTFDEIQKHILDGKKEGTIKFVTIQEKHYKEFKGR